DNDEGAGPQAADDQVLREATVAPVTFNVLTNDVDFANTGTLTVTISEQPESGTAVVNNDNTITYTPAAAGPTAPQFLTYRVSNGNDSDSAQVSIFTSGVIAGADPIDPAKTALYIGGTSAADKITISKKKTQLVIKNGKTILATVDAPTG